MKKGLNSAQRSGSVDVTFNVSKDAANHIRQSVVSSWQRMQDLGVISVQLDREQLMCTDSRSCTEISKTQSTELKHYTQPSYVCNGYIQSEAVVRSRRRSSRGGKRSRHSVCEVNKRMHNDGSSYMFTDSSTVSASDQERNFCRIGDNAGRRTDLTMSEHFKSVSFQNVSSSHLPSCMSSNRAYSDTALNTVSARKPVEVNMLQPMSDEVDSTKILNTVPSQNLPPPSTPFVPKRRKRRKPAETESAKALSYMAVTCVNNTMLPVSINSSMVHASNIGWQNCINRQMLNGTYPHQFHQYAVNNARFMPLRYTGPCGPVAVANYAQLPAERQMVLDSCMNVSTAVGSLPVTSTRLKDANKVRSVTATCSPLLPSGSSVLYPLQDNSGQLCQPVDTGFSQACSPKLSSHLAQGTLELKRNPETYCEYPAAIAETKATDCAERLCKSVKSQPCDASLLRVPTERNSCSDITKSGSVLMTESSNAWNSLPFNTDGSHTSVPKSSEALSSSSVDVIENIHCTSALALAVSTTSVCSTLKSFNFVGQSDVICNSRVQPVSVSAAVKKQKPDVLNGCHFSSDCMPANVQLTSDLSVSVAQIVDNRNCCLSSTTSDNTATDNRHDFQIAVGQSSFTKPALNCNQETSQMVSTLHSANAQSPYE